MDGRAGMRDRHTRPTPFALAAPNSVRGILKRRLRRGIDFESIDDSDPNWVRRR